MTITPYLTNKIDMKSLIFYCLLSISFVASAQPTKPIEYGLKSFSINDPHLGKINFYLDTVNIGKKAPLFIDINGSGGEPLCFLIKGTKFTSVANTFDTKVIARTADKYHYIILDKPGTPFCDTLKTSQTVQTFDLKALTTSYQYSREYNEKLSLDWRVAATKKVIGYLIKNHYWDKSKIVAYGYSEGAQVVPALAVSEKRITHIAALAGSGLNQLADGITNWRVKAKNGIVSHEAAQDSVTKKFQRISEIYKDPLSATKMIDGHSYKRWASFGSVPPIEYLRRLKIPIFLVAATNDDSSPIYGLDYVMLEFMRLGKTNLRYEVCVGCNHYLNSTSATPAPDYLQLVLEWVEKS